MDRWLRRGIERLFRDRITVSNAAKPGEVAELVRRLAPRPVSTLRRFGPPGDGGYVMPDDLEGAVACLSPGVAAESRFDDAMAERGLDVVMADASVSGPASDNPRFKFLKNFIDVAPIGQCITLDQLAGYARSDGDLILQMDIEGAEYRVLASMSDALLRRLRIMVIEFHDVDQIFSRFGLVTIRGVFDRLLETHAVVHIHPNNNTAAVHRFGLSVPPLMEFTFYRRDRLAGAQYVDLSEIESLDYCCVPHKPPLPLPACWRRAA